MVSQIPEGRGVPAPRCAIISSAFFSPTAGKKVYDHWLENIQDWCISRQLWWGHRVPVWYRGEEVRCQVESPGDDWTQDPDVLDTWFSLVALGARDHG